MPPVVAAIAIGSNLGDRAAHIEFAFHALASLPGTRLLHRSSIRETEPVAVSHADPGDAYLNAAALIETTLTPRELLGALHEIERRAGRDRSAQPHGAARTLDLDLLTHGNAVLDDPGLVLPHPRLAGRLFVLEPLAEIAPSLAVPGTRRTVSQLLCELRSRCGV